MEDTQSNYNGWMEGKESQDQPCASLCINRLSEGPKAGASFGMTGSSHTKCGAYLGL